LPRPFGGAILESILANASISMRQRTHVRQPTYSNPFIVLRIFSALEKVIPTHSRNFCHTLPDLNFISFIFCCATSPLFNFNN